jgi:hypothetical protein
VIITVIAGRWFNGILNSAWRFQCLLRAQRCDDHTVTFQRAWPPWEVRTTTTGGVGRLFTPLEISEDRCVGRLVAVKANTRDHERNIASTDIRCNTSGLAGAPTAYFGYRWGGVAAATADGANPVMRRNR